MMQFAAWQVSYASKSGRSNLLMGKSLSMLLDNAGLKLDFLQAKARLAHGGGRVCADLVDGSRAVPL